MRRNFSSLFKYHVMKRLYFISLIVLIISSCTDKDQSITTDSIELIKSGNSINLSDLIDETEYVFLNFNRNNFVIGEITGTKLMDNEILVKQKIGNITMFQRFNRNGEYLNEIGDYGRGAGEIYNPRDIIDVNGNFVIWDYRGLHQISKHGKYLKFLFEAQIPGTRFFHNQNSYYFIHEFTSPGFMSEYTDHGKLKKVFSKNEHQFGHLGYCSIEQFDNDSIHIASPLVDTIYSFSNSMLKPLYYINTKSNKSFQKVLLETKDLSPLDQLKVINKEKPVTIQKYLENDNYVFIAYSIDTKTQYLLRNKENSDNIYFSSIINDLDNGLWGTPMLLTENNELWSVIYPYEIENKTLLKKIIKSHQNTISSIKNDNPFYIKYTLNKNINLNSIINAK